MALDANGDLSARVRFLRISADDTHMLQAFWHIVEPKLPAILDGFYRHVTSEPRLQAMLGDKIPHLKQVQGTHWQRLFTGAWMPAITQAFAGSVSRITGSAWNRDGRSAATAMS